MGRARPSSASRTRSTVAPQSSKGEGAIIEEYYEVGSQLTKDAVGSNGTVMRGVRRSDEKNFAVKVMEKDTSEEAKGHQIRALTEVDHNGIIKLVDWFETQTRLYVVMELATGGELFGRIQQRRNFSERDAAAAFRQVLEGVGHMHARGIVHCDLKPENILYEDDSDNQLKIADFGFAQFIPGGSDPKLYAKCGTLSYVAPEILAETGYDTKADMWSLGVILYVMLSGLPPFGRASRDPQGVMRNILGAKYSFPQTWFAKISEEAKDMIASLLTLDAAQRLSWDQALEHPWMKGNPPDTVLGREYLLELGNFNQCRGMYKLASHALAGLVSRFAQPDAMAAISSSQTSTLHRLLEEGSIQPLISLAYSRLADERRNACNALANLALKEEYVDCITSEGGLRRLIQIAFKDHASSDEKFFAALAMARISRRGEGRAAMLESDANEDDAGHSVLTALAHLAKPPPHNALRVCRKAVEALSLMVQEEDQHLQLVGAGALEGMVFQCGQLDDNAFRGPALQALRQLFRNAGGGRAEGRAEPAAINEKLADVYQQALASKDSDAPDRSRISKQFLHGFASLVLLLQAEGLLESFAETGGDQPWHDVLDIVDGVALPELAAEDSALEPLERSPSVIFRMTDLQPLREHLEKGNKLLEQLTGKPSPSLRWSDRMDYERETSVMLLDEQAVPRDEPAPANLSDEQVAELEAELASLSQDRKKMVNLVVSTSEGKRCSIPESILRITNELTDVILCMTDVLQAAHGPG